MGKLPSKKSVLPAWANDFFTSDSLFGSDFFDFDSAIRKFDSLGRIPSANIIENGKDFKIELAVPGMSKKDFDVKVENGILSISSEKESESKEEKKNYTCKEYSYNSFKRSFRLPENTLPEKIDAKYDNGILHITVPKKEATVEKPAKKIKVG